MGRGIHSKAFEQSPSKVLEKILAEVLEQSPSKVLEESPAKVLEQSPSKVSLGPEPFQDWNGYISFSGKYVVVGNSEDCAIGTKEITTASECRAAAEDLRLSLGSPFAFLNCHRYCLVYNNMVFFGLNTAKAPSSDSMCAAVCVKEGTTTNSGKSSFRFKLSSLVIHSVDSDIFNSQN